VGRETERERERERERKREREKMIEMIEKAGKLVAVQGRTDVA
jgi:hypothetical protein